MLYHRREYHVVIYIIIKVSAWRGVDYLRHEKLLLLIRDYMEYITLYIIIFMTPNHGGTTQ